MRIHVQGPSHVTALAEKSKKDKEKEKEKDLVQLSIYSAASLANKATAPSVLDPVLENFRVTVISRCLRARLTPEQVAELSDLLSSETKALPRSSSGVRDYLPQVLKRQREEVTKRIQKRSFLLYFLPSINFSF